MLRLTTLLPVCACVCVCVCGVCVCGVCVCVVRVCVCARARSRTSVLQCVHHLENLDGSQDTQGNEGTLHTSHFGDSIDGILDFKFCVIIGLFLLWVSRRILTVARMLQVW